MITEQQKYLSGIFKGIGFAMLTPFGSVIFQWIVSKNGAYFEHFIDSMIVLFIGIVLMGIGYKYLEEK